MKNYLILIILPMLFSAGQKRPLATVEPKEIYDSFAVEQKTLLQKFGFFAEKSTHKKFSDLYKSLKDRNLPIYVTTDCVLHTYHILYDYSLRILEMNFLSPSLNSLTEIMVNENKNFLEKTKGNIKEAALHNLAYFEIVAKLLNPDFVVSKSTEALVNQELNLINEAKEITYSPIFGYREDYSQYKPRGHYTRNETLQRYFRAMMWYGKMTFRLKPEKGDDNNKGKVETVKALLILEAIKNHLEEWKKINAPVILYVGKSDDLTILEYFEIKNKLFPNDNPMAIATDDRKLEIFINEALKYRPPRILSTMVADTLKFEEVTKGMRFFGQKFIPDSYIFQNLVYDKVGTREDPRLFPNGLDVYAVLGSSRAFDILVEKYDANHFLNYEQQIKKLIDEFNSLDDDDWLINLYYGWLYTLKSLLLPIPKFQPAYQDKCLQTALGSWAELRHDTILYAKQSYTMELTAIPPQPKLVKGYIEPIPECYKRLKKLTDISKFELEKQGYLDEVVKSKFEEFSNLLDALMRISEAEIKEIELNEMDFQLIHNIGGTLENLESFPGADYTTETDESAALIADVHTDPNTKQVLEVANDVPALLYTTIEINKKPQIFIGAIYDYYEFLQPISGRLTDEEWQQLSPKPQKPEWVEFFTK